MKLGIGTQHSWITAGLLFALTVTPCNALEIVVPAYFYPTNGGYWNDLNSAASIAPLTAIMNPNSGPGSQQNSDYTSAVGSLRAAGGKVIGYVSSSYANRSLNAVLADIDKYAMWYDIDGIFIDEMTNNTLPANLDFYESIYEHVKSIDATWELMGNPGTATAEQYLTRPTADRLMVFESYGANYLSQVPSAWNADYESSRFVNLLHQLDPDDIAVMEHYVDTAVSRNVGGIFFTDDVLSNPWDRLPSFWDALVSKVAAVNSFVPGPQQVLSNSVPDGMLAVDAERIDWNGIVAYDADVDEAPLPGPELDISTVTIANDSSSLYIRLRADEAVNGLAPPLGITHNIYLDVDNDRESGFIGSGGFLAIGAEFLIQGGRLYRFQGANQETFSWKYLEDLIADDSVTSDIELSVSLATLGLPEAFDWLANAANSNMDDYLPNGADGGAFGNFYRYEVGGGSLVGDYDSSGVVDAADYEYWRTHFGEAGGPADGNSDGVVDGADYTVWRDAFISAPGANLAVAVPEPSLLAIVAFIAAFLPREFARCCRLSRIDS